MFEMKNSNQKSNLILYVMIFMIGIVVLFLRNPEPIINPIVYAEDGTWTALGLRDGWFNAFLFPRKDYFVFLNTFFLLVAATIATAIGGGTIELLPYTIAFVSYSFFTLFSLLVFITVRKVSSNIFAILALILSLLIPLGNSQNEIIGRILQIGFYMPALSVMLFFWREHHQNGIKRYAIDAMIFISAATNPVVFVIAFFYFSYRFFVLKFSFVSVLRENAFLILSILLVSLAILPRLGGQGGIPESFIRGNLLEAAVARPLLYPLVFPWYHKLSDGITLSIFSALSIFVFFALKVSVNVQAKKLTYALIVTIVSYTVITILMRTGLTGLLNSYQTTFPDRYFMGINILVSMLVVLCLSHLASNNRTRVFSAFLGGSLFLVYCTNYALIFEWDKSKMPIGGYLTFKDQICLSTYTSKSANIQIYPELPGWIMSIPKKYVDKTNCTFKSYEELGIARPGVAYKLIPTEPLSSSKNLIINFYESAKNKKLDRIEIMFGTHVRSNPGIAELILESHGGQSVRLPFSLSELLDNRYKSFNLPENEYVSGRIASVTGVGISAWESHNEEGKAFTCMNFIFSDGSRGFTPGCPAF